MKTTKRITIVWQQDNHTNIPFFRIIKRTQNVRKSTLKNIINTFIKKLCVLPGRILLIIKIHMLEYVHNCNIIKYNISCHIHDKNNKQKCKITH